MAKFYFLFFILANVTFGFAQDLPWFFYTSEFRQWAVITGVKEVSEVFEYEQKVPYKYATIASSSGYLAGYKYRNKIEFYRESKNYHIDNLGFVSAVSHGFSDITFDGDSLSLEYPLCKYLISKEGEQDSLIAAFRKSNCSNYQTTHCINSPFDVTKHTFAIDTSGIVFVDSRYFRLDSGIIAYHTDSAKYLRFNYRLSQITDYKENLIENIRTFCYTGDFWVVDNRTYGFVKQNDSVSTFKCLYTHIAEPYARSIHLWDTIDYSKISRITRQKSFNLIEDLPLQLDSTYQLNKVKRALSSLKLKNIDGEYKSEKLVFRHETDNRDGQLSQYIKITVQNSNSIDTYYLSIGVTYFDLYPGRDLLALFQSCLSEAFSHACINEYMSVSGIIDYRLMKTTKKYKQEKLISESVSWFSFEDEQWNSWFYETYDKNGMKKKIEVINNPGRTDAEYLFSISKFAKDEFGFGYFLKNGKYRITYSDNNQIIELVNEAGGILLKFSTGEIVDLIGQKFKGVYNNVSGNYQVIID